MGVKENKVFLHNNCKSADDKIKFMSLILPFFLCYWAWGYFLNIFYTFYFTIGIVIEIKKFLQKLTFENLS